MQLALCLKTKKMDKKKAVNYPHSDYYRIFFRIVGTLNMFYITTFKT